MLIEVLTEILKSYGRPVHLYELDQELYRRLGFYPSLDQLRNTIAGSDRFTTDNDYVKLRKGWSLCENCHKKRGVLWAEVNGIHLYLCLDCCAHFSVEGR